MESSNALADLIAIEHITRMNVISRKSLFDLLSKTEYASSTTECAMKICALLQMLKRDAACLDLTALFSIETISKLCNIWLEFTKDRCELSTHRKKIGEIIPDEHLILDIKLSLVYDLWTGSPSTKPEDIKAFITDQVFIEPTEFQKPSRDECLRAADNKKDPFRSAIWSIASRSTINERISTYCTKALNVLGERSVLQSIADNHTFRRSQIASKNPIFADFLGYSGEVNGNMSVPSRMATGKDAIHDVPRMLAGGKPSGSQFDAGFPQLSVRTVAIDRPQSINVGASNGKLTDGTMITNTTNANENNINSPPTTYTNTTNNSLDPGSRTVSINSEDSLPMSGRDSPRMSRKRRSNNPWSKEEEYLLKQGVVRYGQGSWAKIHREYADTSLGRRTQIDLKDKWRNICRNKTKLEIQAMLAVVESGIDQQILRSLDMDSFESLPPWE